MTSIALLFGCALLALAFLLPGHYFPWLSFQQETAAACGAALLALAAGIGERRHRWPWLAWVALGAAIVPLAQLAGGKIAFHSDAVGAVAYLAGFGVSIATGATLARRADGAVVADALTGALIAAALASAGMALAQWLQLGVDGFIEALAPGGRVYANFGQPNHLATLLVLGMAGAVRWYETRRIGGATLSLAVLLLGWVLVLTGSRTGWLAVGALVLWLLVCRPRMDLRLKPLPLLGALGAFALAVALQPALTGALDLAGSNAAAPRLQAGTRSVHWQAMWEAAWRAPWLGWGWQQASLAHQGVALDFPHTGELITNSHNLLLDLVIWNGIPIGLALFGALFGWIVLRAVRCRSAGQALLLAMVGAVFLHALVEFPLDYLFFLLPVGLLIGVVDGGADATAGPPRSRWPLVLLASGLSGLLIFAAHEYLKVESAMRTLRFVVNGIGVDKVASAPEPDVRLFDWYRAQHRFMLEPIREGLPPNELTATDRVVQRFALPAALFRQAVLHALHTDPAGAERSLRLLCWVHGRRHCDSGRREWQALQVRYSALSQVPFPPTPPGN